MAFHETTTIAHPAADVSDALLDELFHRHITEQMGGEVAAFEKQGTDDGPVTITMVRTVPANRLPDMARKFVGDKLRVEQVEVWSAPAEDGSRTAQITLTVPTAKVSSEVQQTVEAQGEGTQITVEGSVNCRIPLVGGKLAQAAEPMVNKVLGKQAQGLSAWLSR